MSSTVRPVMLPAVGAQSTDSFAAVQSGLAERRQAVGF